jgi:hypothetical protein
MTERKYGKSTIAEIDALSGSGEPLMWWHEAVETMQAMAAHIRELEKEQAYLSEMLGEQASYISDSEERHVRELRAVAEAVRREAYERVDASEYDGIAHAAYAVDAIDVGEIISSVTSKVDAVEQANASIAQWPEWKRELVAQPPQPSGGRPDEIMRHDYPLLQQFHSKHALGTMLAPSCLCCGRQTGEDRPVAVQHIELPAIVICNQCQLAALSSQGAEPVAFALQWPDDVIGNKINPNTVFPTKQLAAEYAEDCLAPNPIIVPLYLHPHPTAQGVPDDAMIERLALTHIAPHFGKYAPNSGYQQTEQFQRLKAFVTAMLALPEQELFTCIGKGGEYELIGLATGAGSSRGTEVKVYRDTATGRLFFRGLDDFENRMARLDRAAAPAGEVGE